MTQQKESHLRSILKGLTWRVIATTMIFIITYFSTGEIKTAMTVAAIEFPVKLLIYYFHERAWQLVPRGGVRKMFGINKKKAEPVEAGRIEKSVVEPETANSI